MLLLACGTTAAATAPLPGQVLAGRVLDADSNEPVPGVEVALLTGDSVVFRASSDGAGEFRLRGDDAGTYVVAFSHIGYAGQASTQVELRPNATTRADFYIAPAALAIEPIRVVVASRSPYLVSEGFYERQERGLAKFMDRREIERYPSTWPSHVLRRMGVSLRNGQPTGCRLLIDRMEIDWDMSIDDFLSKGQIAAIEFHTFAVPVEFRRHHGGCVIVIWTTWGESLRDARGR